MAAGAALEPRRLPRVPGVRPRDILVVLTDDHRYDAMGFRKARHFGDTPMLDRLAREGTRFPRAFVSNALCSPSRAVAPTGLLRNLRLGAGVGARQRHLSGRSPLRRDPRHRPDEVPRPPVPVRNRRPSPVSHPVSAAPASRAPAPSA
ncbi:sulfatase-like hydrolase/transferase [Sphingomonas sp. NCPPB 2930]|uniref:sulfatase-like hydrolase/transferase n=1 Tax=Sphingomonas sp. NCPPB 2930 TaxID=3162788 RepID=UPI0036DA4AF9